ncbi:laminin subunit gamma-1-like [Mya arenaria]|uniref:laminin subunit gamma-1-like n=1 Tax=Mya arenaria TaxID=6604 RepID=UPI0022E7699C|nr:laminin subunit gamma-1-like [Mya arenaria]
MILRSNRDNIYIPAAAVLLTCTLIADKLNCVILEECVNRILSNRQSVTLPELKLHWATRRNLLIYGRGPQQYGELRQRRCWGRKGIPRHPDCVPCKCDLVGSRGSSCDQETGQCDCFSNFLMTLCERCSEGLYNFPNCEECGCSPAGTKAGMNQCNMGTGQCVSQAMYVKSGVKNTTAKTEKIPLDARANLMESLYEPRKEVGCGDTAMPVDFQLSVESSKKLAENCNKSREIEQRTRSQAGSSEWFDERRPRLTDVKIPAKCPRTAIFCAKTKPPHSHGTAGTPEWTEANTTEVNLSKNPPTHHEDQLQGISPEENEETNTPQSSLKAMTMNLMCH